MAYDNSQDYCAFQQAGLADTYGTIGNYNLFMICETLNTNAFRALPDGYSFRLCRRNELEVWKRIVAEEQYVEYAADYYKKVYAKDEDEFFRRCTFVCDADDKPVATSFIWLSYGQINTISWLRVLPEHEGKGLGRALLSKILKMAQCPVYLHTHPTSICAVKLYSDYGFKLITNPVIGYRQNNLAESLPCMQKVMIEADYARLQFVEADDSLHQVALSSEVSKF